MLHRNMIFVTVGLHIDIVLMLILNDSAPGYSRLQRLPQQQPDAVADYFPRRSRHHWPNSKLWQGDGTPAQEMCDLQMRIRN